MGRETPPPPVQPGLVYTHNVLGINMAVIETQGS